MNLHESPFEAFDVILPHLRSRWFRIRFSVLRTSGLGDKVGIECVRARLAAAIGRAPFLYIPTC